MSDEYVYRGSVTPHTARYLWPPVERALDGFTRILDLGCGTGELSSRLVSLGHEVVGIDSSRSGIALARAAHPEASFLEASVYDDLGAVGSFDAAVCLEVIEHCYAPRTVARTLSQVVRPGGCVVLSTPYHGYLKNLAIALLGRSDAHFNPLWDHGHIKFWSERTIRTLLAEAGIEITAIHRAGRVGPLAMSMVVVGRVPTQAPRR